MTVEAALPIANYTVAGVGPYAISWPYGAGTLRARVTNSDGSVTALTSSEFLVTPESSPTAGNLHLTPTLAALHADKLLTLYRVTPDEQGWQARLGAREEGLAAQLDSMVRRQQELSAMASAMSPGSVAAAMDAKYWAGVATATIARRFATVGAVRVDLTLGYASDAINPIAPGEAVATVMDGFVLKCVSPAAAYDEVTANGVRFVETGTRFSTRQRFAQAITRGDLAGLPDGATVYAGGKAFVRLSTAAMIDDLPGFHAPYMAQNHLLSADWQPRPTAVSATEIPRHRANLDKIAARHPDLTHAHVLGDLVDLASQHDTGVAPEYGFPEFLADWRNRLPIPLENSFFLAGNHDRDGTGLGQHQKAWSLQSYRKWIGREYYATLQGNLLMVYAGDMGGSTSGEITDAVVDWMRQIITTNGDKNIILCLHHPLAGTYQGFTEVSDPLWVQAGSTRITSILSSVDNIAAVLYGHVGSAFQFNDETHFGTRHIQIGMHLPGNVDNGRDDHYYIMRMLHGATTIPIEQWNATTDAYMSTKTLTLKYPLQLGERLTFDGRGDDMAGPMIRPLRVAVPADEYRTLSGTWSIPTTDVIWAGTFGVEDRAGDNMPADLKVGIGIAYPGATQVGDSHFTGAEPATVGMFLKSRGGTDETSNLETWLQTGNAGAAEDTFALFPSGLSGLAGGYFPFGGLRFGAGMPMHIPDFGTDATAVGVGMDDFGRIAISTNGFAAAYMRRLSDGNFIHFRKNTTTVGSITVTGSTTAYNTTSDGRLKTDVQEFDGLATILGLQVYDYAWLSDGARSRGVIAQDAADVAPHAVTQGGDDPASDPWTVDYSKLVPDLLRAVQQLHGRIAELEGQAS